MSSATLCDQLSVGRNPKSSKPVKHRQTITGTCQTIGPWGGHTSPHKVSRFVPSEVRPPEQLQQPECVQTNSWELQFCEHYWSSWESNTCNTPRERQRRGIEWELGSLGTSPKRPWMQITQCTSTHTMHIRVRPYTWCSGIQLDMSSKSTRGYYSLWQ